MKMHEVKLEGLALDMTTNTPVAVPLWWLSGQGWDGDWEAAALADQDLDGFPTWMEYLTGTDSARASSLQPFSA